MILYFQHLQEVAASMITIVIRTDLVVAILCIEACGVDGATYASESSPSHWLARAASLLNRFWDSYL